VAVRQRRGLGQTEPPVTGQLLTEVRSLSQPLREPGELDPLLERIGDARFVLLGEASHGTHEYYARRATLSRRLLGKKGFSYIAVEGEWPDCYGVNRYVKGFPDSGDDAREVLHAFERWPTWMWANEDVAELAEWMRLHNHRRPDGQKTGFFGLDVYSLWDSLYQVLGYVRRHAPNRCQPHEMRSGASSLTARTCRSTRATRWVDASCEREVIALLTELRRAARTDTRVGDDAAFDAEQNALVVRGAEHYCRTVARGGAHSWNVLDRHMAMTLDRLMRRHGPNSRAIVWAHNTHVGDARFMDMEDSGLVNIGQLVRETHVTEGVVRVAFGSYQGSVIAGTG
jgi:erythromycin esterase-like protein